MIQDSFQEGSVRIHARGKKNISEPAASWTEHKLFTQCQTDVPASSNMLVRTINSPSDYTMRVPADRLASDIRHDGPAHTCRFLISFRRRLISCRLFGLFRSDSSLQTDCECCHRLIFMIWKGQQKQWKVKKTPQGVTSWSLRVSCLM